MMTDDSFDTGERQRFLEESKGDPHTTIPEQKSSEHYAIPAFAKLIFDCLNSIV